MKKLLIVLLSAILFTSCNKDEQDPDIKTTNQLVDKKWKATYAESKSIATGQVVTDLTKGDPEYTKDDYYLWSTNKTYILSDNKVLRSNSPVTLDEGSWSISKSVLSMTSLKSVTNYPMKIVELSNNTMKGEVTKDGMVITYTFTTTE